MVFKGDSHHDVYDRWMDEGLEEGKIVQELRLEEHRDIFEKENVSSFKQHDSPWVLVSC